MYKRIRPISLIVLNLTMCISCLIVSLNLLIYGPIKILELNSYIVAIEVLLAFVAVVLNAMEALKLRRGIKL